MGKTKAVLLSIIFIIVSISVAFYYIDMSKNAQIKISENLIINEARSQFQNIVNTRSWNSQFGGVYVKSDKLKPNKYLPDNHIFTINNEKLIKINPAWMTRQISEISNNNSNYYYKITSLQPINPDNKADKFENKALNIFEKTNTQEYFEFNKAKTKFNYMGALKVEPSCLACHYEQNYQIGDFMGGIRVTIPTNDYKDFFDSLIENNDVTKTFIIIISLLLFLIIMWFINNIYSRQSIIERISEKNRELTQRYELAIEGSNDGLWDWNLQTNEIYFSQKWKTMLGYGESEFENSIDNWHKNIHPEDIENVIFDISQNQKGLSSQYENIHRIKHKNGKWIWILNRAKTIFDKNGIATRMVGFQTDITRQKRLEISLNQSQNNLLKAEEMANMAFWKIDIKSMKLTYSQNLKNIFGISENEEITIKELFKTFIYHEDRKRVSDELTQAIRNKKSYNVKYRFQKNGSNEIRYINCNVEVQIINNKVKSAIGTIQDITDIQLIQNELNILRMAIEHAPISFVITDIDGNIEYVNPAFTAVTGYTYEEAIGQNPRILKSNLTDGQDYENLWNTISSGKMWSGTFKNINKNGEEFWELAFISPIFSEDNGKIIKYLAIKQEITKEIFLKKELHNKEELMIAQSRHAAMGEMISMIAHQWRQPIAVIAMGANNIMADIELDMLNNESLKDGLNEIITQTKYLSQTIDDFKNFFKPNKEKDLVSVQEVIEEALKVMGKLLESINITVIQEYKSNIQIYTYSKELLQVFINIIRNAKEALREKKEDNRIITINEYLKNDNIIIEISDNAGGIEENIIGKVFEPYFTTKKEVGTGLGLYMSKTIIEKHMNGKLTVYNKPAGACFKIEFPIKDI